MIKKRIKCFLTLKNPQRFFLFFTTVNCFNIERASFWSSFVSSKTRAFFEKQSFQGPTSTDTRRLFTSTMATHPHDDIEVRPLLVLNSETCLEFSWIESDLFLFSLRFCLIFSHRPSRNSTLTLRKYYKKWNWSWNRKTMNIKSVWVVCARKLFPIHENLLFMILNRSQTESRDVRRNRQLEVVGCVSQLTSISASLKTRTHLIGNPHKPKC